LRIGPLPAGDAMGRWRACAFRPDRAGSPTGSDSCHKHGDRSPQGGSHWRFGNSRQARRWR